jgi:hypothetical protein
VVDLMVADERRKGYRKGSRKICEGVKRKDEAE